MVALNVECHFAVRHVDLLDDAPFSSGDNCPYPRYRRIIAQESDINGTHDFGYVTVLAQ